jgi:hypothetical protein
MTTDPGDRHTAGGLLSDNERINPGVYAILDLDVTTPEVTSVTSEGSAIDILTDGTGERRNQVRSALRHARIGI